MKRTHHCEYVYVEVINKCHETERYTPLLSVRPSSLTYWGLGVMRSFT